MDHTLKYDNALVFKHMTNILPMLLVLTQLMNIPLSFQDEFRMNKTQVTLKQNHGIKPLGGSALTSGFT